jgi:osmotically-inducible protein OsmY
MTIRLFSITLLAVALVAAAGCAPAELRRDAPEYLSDTWITTKVNAAVAEDSELRVLDVKVQTFDGVVQLSGFVDNERQVNRAEQVAREIEGVEEVRNDLQIRPRRAGG